MADKQTTTHKKDTMHVPSCGSFALYLRPVRELGYKRTHGKSNIGGRPGGWEVSRLESSSLSRSELEHSYWVVIIQCSA